MQFCRRLTRPKCLERAAATTRQRQVRLLSEAPLDDLRDNLDEDKDLDQNGAKSLGYQDLVQKGAWFTCISRSLMWRRLEASARLP